MPRPTQLAKPKARLTAGIGRRAEEKGSLTPRTTIELQEYNPQWPQQFTRVKTELMQRLNELVLDIQHIGSTAVPHMVAKPTIDILLITPDLEALDNAKRETTEMGFNGLGEYGVDGRRYFTRYHPAHCAINLHAFQPGHRHAIDLLLLRDFLRSNQAARQRFETCKRAIAAEHRTNPGAYQAGKQPIIEWLLARATGRR